MCAGQHQPAVQEGKEEEDERQEEHEEPRPRPRAVAGISDASHLYKQTHR